MPKPKPKRAMPKPKPSKKTTRSTKEKSKLLDDEYQPYKQKVKFYDEKVLHNYKLLAKEEKDHQIFRKELREHTLYIKKIKRTIKFAEKHRDKIMKSWKANQQRLTQRQNFRKAAPKAGSVKRMVKLSPQKAEFCTYGLGVRKGGALGEMTCTDDCHVFPYP